MMSSFQQPQLPPILQAKLDAARKARAEAAAAAGAGAGASAVATTHQQNPTPNLLSAGGRVGAPPSHTSYPYAQQQTQTTNRIPLQPVNQNYQPITATAPTTISTAKHPTYQPLSINTAPPPPTTWKPPNPPIMQQQPPPPRVQQQPPPPNPFMNSMAPRPIARPQQQPPQPQLPTPYQQQPQQIHTQTIRPMHTIPPTATTNTAAGPATGFMSRSAPSFMGNRGVAAATTAAHQQPWQPAQSAASGQAPTTTPNRIQPPVNIGHPQSGQPQPPQQRQQPTIAQPPSNMPWRPNIPSSTSAAAVPSVPPSQPQSVQPPPVPMNIPWRPNQPTGNINRGPTPTQIPSTTSAPNNAAGPASMWSNVRLPPSMTSNPTTNPPVTPTKPPPSSSSAAAADSNQSTFLSRFQQPVTSSSTSPHKGGDKSQVIPLCRQHSLPMNSNICRKPPNENQKFWNCCLKYSAPKESCNSFVWDRDLATSGLRMQQIGPNGECLSEVQFSADLVSGEQFSITLTPPEPAAIAFLKSEGGVMDEKAANATQYHKANPPTWIFSLQQYEDIMHKLEAQRQQHKKPWIIVPIPASARHLLLKDLQMQRLTSYAKEHQLPESEAAHSIAARLAPSPVFSPSTAGEDSPIITGSRRTNDSHSADEDDAPSSSKKKKKGGSLLTTKSQQKQKVANERIKKMQTAVASKRTLTDEEEFKLNEDKVPDTIRLWLLPFQLEGVQYLVSRGGRGLLADEMGLGKSIQAIAVAAYYHQDWPLLVICPSSLRYTWLDEIKKWMPFLKSEQIFVIFNAKDGRAVLTKDATHKKVLGREFGVIIVSYDLVPKLKEEIAGYHFGVVIADESHNLKSGQALRTKAILPILKQATRAILLSGTPAMNRPSELFTQISAIKPKLFPNFKEFGMRYCNGHKGAFGMDYSGGSHLLELHILLKKYLLIRREKSDVLKQLPSKRRQTITLDVPAAKLSKLKKLQAEHDAAMVDVDLSRGSKDPHLSRMFQLTGEAKVESVCEYIEELIESNVKFLLFAHHVHVMDALEEFIRNKQRHMVNYIRIDGSTPAVKRSEYVKQFQEDDTYKIAILSITAAGTGLTLTAASHVVMAELNWTPAILVQAEDRVHRIGQDFACNIHYLLARGTLDDIMWPLISKKLAVIGQAVSGEDMHMEVAEQKQYSSMDKEQKRLTGFFTAVDEKDDTMDESSEMKQSHDLRMDNEEIALFLKPGYSTSSTPSSASKRRSARPSPAKRQKTESSAASSSTSVSGNSTMSGSTGGGNDDSPSLFDLHDDDDDMIDMTCTPVNTRPISTPGVSASSVNTVKTPTTTSSATGTRSPNVLQATFGRRQPQMITPSPTTKPSASSSPTITKTPKSTSPPTSSTKSFPKLSSPSQTSSAHASSVKRRKRIRDDSDHDDDDALIVSEDVETDEVKVMVDDLFSSPVQVTNADVESDEGEFDLVDPDEFMTEATKSTTVQQPPLETPSISTSNPSIKKAPTSIPTESTAGADVSELNDEFPELEDEFLED